jgi:trypsin-like peptidase
VKLADGRSYKASLVGASPSHDIAVLKIGVDFKRPPAVPVGTSHDLKVGQKVFPIGNPFGLDWTLTTGIVSALPTLNAKCPCTVKPWRFLRRSSDIRCREHPLCYALRPGPPGQCEQAPPGTCATCRTRPSRLASFAIND